MRDDSPSGRPAWAIVLLSCAVGVGFGSGAQAEDEPKTRLEFFISPVVDLHFYVRALAEGNSSAVPEAYRRAVAVAEIVGRELGGGRWGAMESNLGDCRTAAELRERFGTLPAEYRPRFGPEGKPIALRDLAVKMADEYSACEGHFLEHTWPDHQRIVQEDLRRIESDFIPQFDKLLADMLEHLGIADPQITVPIYLVAEAYFPGAFTMRTHEGTPVLFVQTRRPHHEGTLLFELILHESCHTLDMSSESVFSVLRKKLADAGVSSRSDLYHDVPHTIMFVQAAETIRRFLDGNHKAYGDVEGYYRRVGFAGTMVPPVWIEYLDGKCTREEALDRMVKATVALGASD